MWLFTQHGFFSVVCGRKQDGSEAVDARVIMIRARDRTHLENLRQRCSISDYEIKEDEGTDYPYRLIVDSYTWEYIMAVLVREIDYGNFKGHVETHRPKKTGIRAWASYVHLLHSVWGLGRAFQLQCLKPPRIDKNRNYDAKRRGRHHEKKPDSDQNHQPTLGRGVRPGEREPSLDQ